MLVQNLNYNISGLIPYENYSYIIENLHSNWPVHINPSSGSVSSSSDSIKLDASVIFCEDHSNCSDSFEQNSGLFRHGDDPYVKLRVRLQSSALDNPVYSDVLTMTCSGCAPIPEITADNGAIELTDTNLGTITFTINNLRPYAEYNYYFNDVISNYPVVLTNIPKSGTFTPSESSYTLKADLAFCHYEDCTNPTFGLDHLSKIEHQQCHNYYTNFNLSVTSNHMLSDIKSNTVEVECHNCLPKTTISNPSLVTLNNISSNKYSLITSFNGLQPYNKYEYSILLKEANHEVSFNSLSGYFYTKNETSKNIETKLVFCENSGLCEYPHSLGSTVDYDCAKNKYIEFNVKLDSDCLSESILGDITRVDCDNCLPVVNVSLPTSMNTLTSTNLVSVTGSITNLKPSQSYSYYFTGDNNWPVVLDNVSGSFVAKTTSASISTKLLFCYPSGSCFNENGLLPHVPSSSAQKMLNNNNLYSKLQLNIIPTHCSDKIYSSNILDINCKDCLPCVRYANILFEGSPTITLDSGCCQGQKLLRVNVTNAVAGDRYTYKFDNVNGAGVNSVVFNPTSGEIYFGSGGAGTINTICNVDLMDHAQTLLNCELTHDNTNSKVMDTVVLVCNNNNC